MDELDALLDAATRPCQGGIHTLDERGQALLRRARERRRAGIANPGSVELVRLIGGMSESAVRRYMQHGCSCEC